MRARDKWKIRNSSSNRGIYRVRSSNRYSGVAIALENEDMEGGRKRKFPDPKSDHLQNIRSHPCSEQHEPLQDTRSDAAKTSEFEYFKKLKEAARSVYPLHREKSQVKNVESNKYAREKTMKLKQMDNGLKLSVPTGNERLEMINMVETRDKDIGFPLLNEKVTPIKYNRWPSTFHCYPNDTGVQHSDKGIFASKRWKLHQWVTGTFQEIDELSSKGFSLVSILLNRLFPEDNKENRDWEPKNSQAEISSRYQLPLFFDNNTHSMGHYRKHTNHLLEFENGAYQDDCFTRYLSERHRDVILPELDNVCADSPSTNYPIKTYFPCKDIKPYYNIDASVTESLFPETNSCLQIQSETHGSIAWVDHLKVFDRCHEHDPNGSLLHEQPHPLLLDWDYSDDKVDQGLSISAYNRNMSLLAHSGDNNHCQSHDRQDESALCSSSLVSSCFLNCNSLTQHSSANFWRVHDFGRYFKDESYLYAKLDHFPAAFSCNPDSLKYLHGLSENCSTNNLLEPRNAVCSPQDHFWNLNTVIYENNGHELESLFFSTGLDRELGEEHLSVSDFSTQNQFSIVPALQNPQYVGPYACFLGEEDKECCLYNPSCTSNYSDSLNFQESSALNFQISCDKRDSLQRHSTSLGLPILEIYHSEADDDNEWKFE